MINLVSFEPSHFVQLVEVPIHVAHGDAHFEQTPSILKKPTGHYFRQVFSYKNGVKPVGSHEVHASEVPLQPIHGDVQKSQD